MCGIVGYIGKKEPTDVLIEGLRRLEYRGYDSAGVAIFDKGKVKIERAVGKLKELENALKGKHFSGPIGVGHTRWATHGRTSLENAHPHHAGKVTVVHNGIIENYVELREGLKKKGHKFDSKTDTEVICHLIDEELKTSPNALDAIQGAVNKLMGAFALGIIFDDDQGRLYAVRSGAPLIVGVGDHEQFIASDIPALLKFTNQVIYLHDEEIAVCTTDDCSIVNFKNDPVERSPQTIDWSVEMGEKEGFPHYMLKEIHEQPRAVKETIDQYIDKSTMLPSFPDLFTQEQLENISRIEIVACGTSYYAGLVSQYYFEEFVRVPTHVELASEYRYRHPVADKNTLVIGISQSGETADTLAAVKMANKLGAITVGLTNVRGSTITREAKGSFNTHAGLEIGVASTKAFTTQVSALFLLSLFMANARKSLETGFVAHSVKEIIELPGLIERALKRESRIQEIAKIYQGYQNFFFIGRHLLYPIALEGALKLKEISYITAEGYAAGEMKHGPIALVDQELPVVCLAPSGPTYDKVLSNIEEIRAREGIILGIGDKEDSRLRESSREYIPMPDVPYYLSPIIYTIPIQLLAYYIARERGTDIDQPKNLAKSVTVE
ncbi:glutamine--fructose-6-phosphate transaminase (isomerizing) [Bdellovibrionota bacterium]